MLKRFFMGMRFAVLLAFTLVVVWQVQDRYANASSAQIITSLGNGVYRYRYTITADSTTSASFSLAPGEMDITGWVEHVVINGVRAESGTSNCTSGTSVYLTDVDGVDILGGAVDSASSGGSPYQVRPKFLSPIGGKPYGDRYVKSGVTVGVVGNSVEGASMVVDIIFRNVR